MTRKEIMYYTGINLNKRDNTIKIRDKKYIIDDKLKLLIRIKNLLIAFEVVLGTFIYRYILDTRFNGLLSDSNGAELTTGIIISLIFIFTIGILAYLIPQLIIPKDIDDFQIEEVLQ